MDTHAIKTNVKCFFDYVNSKDLIEISKWIDEYATEDFVNHTTPFGEAPDRDGLKESFRQLLKMFPDITFNMEEMVFENDILCFRMTVCGTHSVPLAGIPPTNKRYEITGFVMLRYKNGKIVDRWALIDTFGQLKQLGIHPS